MRQLLVICVFIFLSFSLRGQRQHAFDINEKLGRGINYGNMLEAPSETEWGNPWQPEYPEIIAELGFDHVRIPIRWEPEDRSLATAPYTINADFMARVKEVVDASLNAGLMVIINMHHHDDLYANPEQEKARFLAQWEQISEAFKDYADSLVFEILNEPHGNLTPDKWNAFLRDALDVIRVENPTRVVLIGTPEYGGLGGLSVLHLPDDPNIIITIHYYNPFQFTHQGADWVGEDADAWLGTEWHDTDVDRAVIQSEFAPLIELSENENVPVNIGEFGAYSTADIVSREKWTTYLARYFEELGWSWAYWEFSAGFGIYNPQNEMFVQELVDALLHNEMPDPVVYERTVVYQSDFTTDVDGWHLQTSSDASGSLTRESDALKVTINKAGAETWHVQLVKSNLSLKAGRKYSVTFTGHAEAARSLTWYVGMSVDPWSAYSGWNSATLTDELATYTATFDMTERDATARMAFDLGTNDVDVVITKVLLEELSLMEPEEPDTVLSIYRNKQVRVYPNPTADLLNFDNDGRFHELTLINMIGQKLLSRNLRNGLNAISLYDLAPGTYVIMLEGPGVKQTFVIRRK